jgi:DNA polymerase
MPFGLKYAGAHTLRWSGDAKVNMQNLRRIPAFGLQSGLLQQDDKAIARYLAYKKENGKWPDEVKFAIDFRALLLPRPGRQMIVSDLAQIEPRVLAWLSGNTEMLDKIRAGQSVYEAFARANFGYTGGRMDKSTDAYKLIKIQVLQLGYQCGADKFITTALRESGIDLTASDPEFETVVDPLTDVETKVPGRGAFARKLVRDFRSASPKITALWQKLDEGFRSSVGGDFTVTLPNGRKMIYKNVRAQGRMEKSKKDGRPYLKTEYSCEIGGRRTNAYGGKITENLCQAIGRDVFADGLLRIHKKGWPILFSAHDEAVLEVDASVTPQDVEAAMSVTPEWMPGLPVAAEAKIVERYCK